MSTNCPVCHDTIICEPDGACWCMQLPPFTSVPMDASAWCLCPACLQRTHRLSEPRPVTISPEERQRRERAVEQARAANIRKGYGHDPVLEAINARFIKGDIDLAGINREILAAIKAGT